MNVRNAKEKNKLKRRQRRIEPKDKRRKVVLRRAKKVQINPTLESLSRRDDWLMGHNLSFGNPGKKIARVVTKSQSNSLWCTILLQTS